MKSAVFTYSPEKIVHYYSFYSTHMHRCAPHRDCFTGNVVKEAFLSGNALYLFIEYARKGPYIKCARSFYYPVPPPAIMMSNKIRTHGNDIGINDYWSDLTGNIT